MPFKNYFQHVANQSAHKKVLTEELPKAKHGQIAFHFFEEFTFDNGKKDPLLLAGVIDRTLLDEVRKAAKKESVGECTVNAADKLEFRAIKGSINLSKLAKAVVVSGMRNEPCVISGAGVAEDHTAEQTTTAAYTDSVFTEPANGSQAAYTDSVFTQPANGSAPEPPTYTAGIGDPQPEEAQTPAVRPPAPRKEMESLDQKLEQRGLHLTEKQLEAQRRAAAPKETRDLVGPDGRQLTDQQKAIYQKAEKALALLREKLRAKNNEWKAASPETKGALENEVRKLAEQLKQSQQKLAQLGWGEAQRAPDTTGHPLGADAATKALLDPESKIAERTPVLTELRVLLASESPDLGEAKKILGECSKFVHGLPDGDPEKAGYLKQFKEMSAHYLKLEKMQPHRERIAQAEADAEKRAQAFAPKKRLSKAELEEALHNRAAAILEKFDDQFNKFTPKEALNGRDPFEEVEKSAITSATAAVDCFTDVRGFYRTTLDTLRKKAEGEKLDASEIESEKTLTENLARFQSIEDLVPKILAMPLANDREKLIGDLQKLTSDLRIIAVDDLATIL